MCANVLLWLCLALLLLIVIMVALRYQTISEIVGAYDRVKDLTKHPRTKSEAEVIRIIEKITNEKFPTVYPGWLRYKGRKLELDGYSRKLKIGVEFSGPLHTKFYADKETYAQYHERLQRDRAKIEICKRNGVHLIVIDMSIPSRHWVTYIRSRLYDIGYLKEKPLDYMMEKIAEPYENAEFAREAGVN